MPHLSWNEVRDRAVHFSRDHAEDSSEAAQKQTFWNDFFHVFGLRRASLAAFEANVINLKGNKGAIDLLWRGKLLVEHKSKGEDLDYAQFIFYDLEPEEQKELPLFAGRIVESHRFSLKDFPKHIRSSPSCSGRRACG